MIKIHGKGQWDWILQVVWFFPKNVYFRYVIVQTILHVPYKSPRLEIISQEIIIAFSPLLSFQIIAKKLNMFTTDLCMTYICIWLNLFVLEQET